MKKALLLLFWSGPVIWALAFAVQDAAHLPALDGERAYAPPVQLAILEDQAIRESSSLVASRRNPGLYWTHNDSGDGPFLYAFDREGKRRGVWRVSGAQARDWEDMAAGPGPRRGEVYLYVGDIGDNGRSREEIIVYRVVEPRLTAEDAAATKSAPRATQPAEAFRLRYPDKKHDAEALLVHPKTGDLYLVTKKRSSEPVLVYKAAAPLSAERPMTLARVGELNLPAPSWNRFGGMVTGGDISPDGKYVILCDYFGGFEFALPARSKEGFDAIWRQTPTIVTLGARRQGEAVCYRLDGAALLTTSEGLPAPLTEIARRGKEK